MDFSDRNTLNFIAFMILLALAIIFIIASSFTKKKNKFSEIAKETGAKHIGNKFTGMIKDIPFECEYDPGGRIIPSVFDIKLFFSFPALLLIYKKNIINELSTASGLNKEILTDDKLFDSKYYIECEYPDVARKLLQNSGIRTIISEIMSAHYVRSVSFDSNCMCVNLFNFDPSSNLITGKMIKSLLMNMERLCAISPLSETAIPSGFSPANMKSAVLPKIDNTGMFVLAVWFIIGVFVKIAEHPLDGYMFENKISTAFIISLIIIAITAIVSIRTNPAFKGKSFSGRYFIEYMFIVSVIVFITIFSVLKFVVKYF